MKKRIILLVPFTGLSYIILAFFNFLQPMLIRNIIDMGLIRKNFNAIGIGVLGLFAVIVLTEIIEFLQLIIFSKLKICLTLDLYQRVFQKLCKISYDFYSERNSSGIIQSINIDIATFETIIDKNVLSLVGSIFKIISGLVGLFVINKVLAGFVVAIIPVKYILVKTFSDKKEKIVNL